MAAVHGHCDAKYHEIEGLFNQGFERDGEIGASFAVNVDGKDVINLWGGYANAERSQTWNENTLVPVFSTTKNVTALATLLLVNEGKISVTDKVAKYWAEFGTNGKQDVEIRHLLSHTSGVAGFDKPATNDTLCDTALATSLLAEQAPQWEPGTASGYHSWTYGFLLGEVIRRFTGLRLKDFIEQRITGPLKADFQLGCKEIDWHRIATIVPPPNPMNFPPLPPDSIGAKTMNPPPSWDFPNSEAFRKAEIGAGNGFTNAAGLVKIFSGVVNGETLKSSTIDEIFEEQCYGKDLAFPMMVRWGNGYALRGYGDTLLDDWLPEGRVACWGGAGGSIVVMDFDRKVTFGYAMNQMTNNPVGSPIVKGYIKAVYEALGVKVGKSNL